MNVVIRVSEKTKKKMIEYYEDKFRDKTPPYAIFQAKDLDTIITMYESGKVMFQGSNADMDSNMWKEIDGQAIDNKKMEQLSKYYSVNAIGSDEVGTGDYFGPIVVTSSYVRKEDIPFLESLGIKDSKKLSDEQILKIVPKFINKIKYNSIILSNEEYNSTYSYDVNMNKIKAIMHNKVLYNLLQEVNNYDYVIVDEFAKEHKYYEYLNKNKNVVTGITFITKAEDKNLAVACSSMISRYIFIKEFDKLSDKLHIPLPKGSGVNVDKTGEELVAKYGKDILGTIAKLNFQNTKRILKTIIW